MIEAERMTRLRGLHGEMHALLVAGDFARKEIDAYAELLAASLEVLFRGIGDSVRRKVQRRRASS